MSGTYRIIGTVSRVRVVTVGGGSFARHVDTDCLVKKRVQKRRWVMVEGEKESLGTGEATCLTLYIPVARVHVIRICETKSFFFALAKRR